MKRRASVFASVLVAALVTTPAAAAPADAGKTVDAQKAVSIAKDAKQRYDRGDWAGALELFQVAESNAHSPVLLLYVARCERNLGHLLKAREQYRRVANEELAAGAPEPFVTAKGEAQRDLEALSARVAKVSLDTAAVVGAEIELDGTKVTELSAIEVDPGAHVARAKVGEREVARASFTAEEGKAAIIRLAPEADRPPPVAPIATRGSAVPGAILLGLGAAGVGAGVVTRVLAFGDVSDVKSRCQGDHCLPSDQAKISSAETLQTVSTICLVAGGAVAVTGLVLVLARPGGKAAPPVALRIGPASIGVSGAF